MILYYKRLYNKMYIKIEKNIRNNFFYPTTSIFKLKKLGWEPKINVPKLIQRILLPVELFISKKDFNSKINIFSESKFNKSVN